jgi:hypothetical protein
MGTTEQVNDGTNRPRVKREFAVTNSKKLSAVHHTRSSSLQDDSSAFSTPSSKEEEATLAGIPSPSS